MAVRLCVAGGMVRSGIDECTEVVMKVEITVKVNGKLVKRLVERVEGTLERMEETVDALTRQVAGETLQASVDALEAPRPLFRQRAAGYGTRAIRPGPSSG